MTGAGGLARRRTERHRRSSYVSPRVSEARRFRRKTRRGWAQFMG